MLGREKNMNPIFAFFGSFFHISPDFFAIVQKAPIPHFRDSLIYFPLGKKPPKIVSKVMSIFFVLTLPSGGVCASHCAVLNSKIIFSELLIFQGKHQEREKEDEITTF